MSAKIWIKLKSLLGPCAKSSISHAHWAFVSNVFSWKILNVSLSWVGFVAHRELFHSAILCPPTKKKCPRGKVHRQNFHGGGGCTVSRTNLCFQLSSFFSLKCHKILPVKTLDPMSHYFYRVLQLTALVFIHLNSCAFFGDIAFTSA